MAEKGVGAPQTFRLEACRSIYLESGIMQNLSKSNVCEDGSGLGVMDRGLESIIRRSIFSILRTDELFEAHRLPFEKPTEYVGIAGKIVLAVV